MPAQTGTYAWNILPAHFHIFLMFSSYRNKAEPPLFETTRSFKFFPSLTSSHSGIFFIQSSLFATFVCWMLYFHRSNHMASTLLTGFPVFPLPHGTLCSPMPVDMFRETAECSRGHSCSPVPLVYNQLALGLAQPRTLTRGPSLFPPEFTLHSFSGIHFLPHILALSFFHSQENWSFYSISPFPSFLSSPWKMCMWFCWFFSLWNIITK